MRKGRGEGSNAGSAIEARESGEERGRGNVILSQDAGSGRGSTLMVFGLEMPVRVLRSR